MVRPLQGAVREVHDRQPDGPACAGGEGPRPAARRQQEVHRARVRTRRRSRRHRLSHRRRGRSPPSRHHRPPGRHRISRANTPPWRPRSKAAPSPPMRPRTCSRRWRERATGFGKYIAAAPQPCAQRSLLIVRSMWNDDFLPAGPAPGRPPRRPHARPPLVRVISRLAAAAVLSVVVSSAGSQAPAPTLDLRQSGHRSGARCLRLPCRIRRASHGRSNHCSDRRGRCSSSSGPPIGDRTARRSSWSCKATSTISAATGSPSSRSATIRCRCSPTSRGGAASPTLCYPMPGRRRSRRTDC